MLIWVVALVALSLVAAVLLRRTASLAGGTHELYRLQQDTAAINARLEDLVGPIVEGLDDVRRGARDPAEVRPQVDGARASLRSLAGEARGLKAPDQLADRVAQLVWELDRATRAADMAGHGIQTLAGQRNPMGTEAQVALKRGTLGLRHAREAVKAIVGGIAALSPAEVNAMPPMPKGAAAALLRTPPPEDDWLAAADAAAALDAATTADAAAAGAPAAGAATAGAPATSSPPAPLVAPPDDVPAPPAAVDAPTSADTAPSA